MAKVSAFVTLLNKNGRDDARSIASSGIITATENNLGDFLVKMEIKNTGVSKTNSGVLTLRIDDAGTFIRTGPILVDEATKNTYLIELQLKQDLDNDDDFSEANEKGKVLRAIIGQPTTRVDTTFGQLLTVNLVGIEYRLKETLTSEEHKFLTPNQSFQRRLDETNATSTGIRLTPITNNLPNAPDLSFIPNQPTRLHDTLTEIIDLLALPDVSGGSFDDHYFDFDPSATNTNHLSVIAEVYGNTVSGVTLDPLSVSIPDTDEEQSVVTDNVEYKNHVIMVGSALGGSMPTERTRFASNFNHAQVRPAWDPLKAYVIGDVVQLLTSTTFKPHLTTYHKALTNHAASVNDPLDQAGVDWEIDFSDIPDYVSGAFYGQGEFVTTTGGGVVNIYQSRLDGTHTTPTGNPTQWALISGFVDTAYTAFVTYTPWTNDVDLWKQTLAGRIKAQGMTPVAQEGWAFDWNISKSNYNRENATSHFETVSPKWVTSELTAEPSPFSNRQNYDGQRHLLATTPTGSEWTGNGETVAEWDDTQTSGSNWIFSKAGVEGDMINDLNVAEMKKHTSGSWTTAWSGTDIANTDRPSPFHICENVGLVAGATNIAAQAIQFTYNWFVDSSNLTDTHHRRTSRGVWISQSFPLPRLDTTSFNTGGLYGGDGTNKPGILSSHFNTNNYDVNRKGLIGWNRGIDVEDMGRVSAIRFKMKVGFFTNSAGSDLVEGQPDVPMTFWAMDKFDRAWYSKFKLRRNGQWDQVRIPVGELAPSQLYFSRWDELAKLNGVVITELDFTLAQKEFSGVQFDWRFVKHWGVQLDESYVETGLYKNGHQRAFEFGEDFIADLQANWFWYMLGPSGTTIKNLLPKHTPVTQNHIRLLAKIVLDDLHFEKEQIVTSDNIAKTDPRTIVEHLATEDDYNNLKKRAEASESRKRFFPQFWHIRATGDVRLKFGQSFIISGTRVAGSPVTMIVSEVTHIYDHDGYHVEVAGVRKFTVSG